MTEFFIESSRQLLPLLLRYEGGEGRGEEANLMSLSRISPLPVRGSPAEGIPIP
jgi:hypothetical protein